MAKTGTKQKKKQDEETERKHKAYRPRVGAYIPHEQVQEIIEAQDDGLYRHLFETMYGLGLRVSEAVGDDTPGHEKPGIRPCDIDPVKPSDVGLECKHVIRIWRKRGKFEILPLPDKLFRSLAEYAKVSQCENESRLFARDRTTVYQHLAKYGRTVDGRFKIGCHVLRRSAGVYWRSQGMPIEDIQQVYSHENMAQTMQYIGLDKRRAFNNFARFNK